LTAGKIVKEFQMKTKHGLFFGFTVLALAAVFTLTGCDNPSGSSRVGRSDPSNPFIGTWTGNGETLFITNSGWEAERTAKGTYTRNGNTATFTATHFWNDGAWVAAGSAALFSTGTVSGNTMVIVYDYYTVIYTKS
jgi:hypothetical protein